MGQNSNLIKMFDIYNKTALYFYTGLLRTKVKIENLKLKETF